MDSTASSGEAFSDVVGALNRCIQTCIDGERAFAAAVSDVHDPDIKALFVVLAKQRTDFVFALQGVVEMLGGIPDDDGSTDGTTDRTYSLLVRRVTRPSDRTVVTHAEKQERRSRATYVAILQDPVLENAPPTVLQMLRRQYDAIRRAHEEMRRKLAILRDQ
jgi:uncharacterized protein (TIGR02284 family)